jgi:hypothetical protein
MLRIGHPERNSSCVTGSTIVISSVSATAGLNAYVTLRRDIAFIETHIPTSSTYFEGGKKSYDRSKKTRLGHVTGNKYFF